jgi:threonine dehydrogenase-like Zn-dependent dehydrogenase
MKTLAEEYILNILIEETKPGEITGTGLAASAVGGGLLGLGAYYLYKKHKAAEVKANLEKDPSKRNMLKAKANQLKMDARKKEMEAKKKDMLQNRQV